MLVANVPPPFLQDATVTLIHDARAVHDTAALHFRYFEANGQTLWIIGVVTPAADSGSSTVPGSEMNAKTGEVTTPPGAKAALKKAGNWKAIATASPAQKYKEGKYSWLEPVESQQHVITVEDYYSPFADGGTIVFRYAPTAAGIAQFDAVRLIFPDWAEPVASASAFVASHRGLLENGEKRAPDIAQLRRLLDNENTFLVVEAFRELAESAHLDGPLALDQLTKAPFPLDSILAYLMLTSRANDELVDQVKAATNASRDQKKLQSIALAAFSVMLFCKQDTKLAAHGRTALETIQLRLKHLKPSPDANSYLNLILKKAGVQ